MGGWVDPKARLDTDTQKQFSNYIENQTKKKLTKNHTNTH